MVISNGRIFDGSDFIGQSCVVIEKGKIKRVCNDNFKSSAQIIDAAGKIVSPGFIDIHMHGIKGNDLMQGNATAICKMASEVIKHGVTSFTPATVTACIQDIQNALKAFEYARSSQDLYKQAQLLGVHLEGPLINPLKKGAHDEKYILAPTIENFLKACGQYEDMIDTVTLSPELTGAQELIKYLYRKGIKIALGHTDASYKDTEHAVYCGASRITHVFNCMKGIHHRQPGILGAALDIDHLYCEIIGDMIHLHPAIIRLIIKAKGSDRCILITDSMEATGLEDGRYRLGSMDVYVSNGCAKLADGSLAGSTLTMDVAVKNIVNEVGIELADVLKMATLNPAKAIGIDSHKGRIYPGYDADIVILDDELKVDKIIVRGRLMD